MGNKKLIRIMCALIAGLFLIGAVSCGGKNDGGGKDATTAATTAATTQKATEAAKATEAETTAADAQAKTDDKSAEKAPTEQKGGVSVEELVALMSKVKDSSELPDWTGSTIKLRVWNGHGTGDASRPISSNNVVNPEIKRIFGIEFDGENSFDNAGQEIMERLAILAATGDFPEIGQNCTNAWTDLSRENKIYELTNLIPKYAPVLENMTKMFAPLSYAKGYQRTGKHWAVGAGWWLKTTGVQRLYPDVDLVRYGSISAPTERGEWGSALWVRDDILKLLYPNAKTQAEIEAMYVEKGFFTREELYDVPLKSRDDVIKFFYDMAKVIKDNKITEDGRPVYASFAFAGQDNWALLSILVSRIRNLLNWNYYTYFDLKTKRIEDGLQADFFMEDLRAFTQMVRDGVMPQSSLLENNEIFNDKLNNGEYAISYAWMTPDRSRFVGSKPWNFRKVYMDIPQGTDRILAFSGENGGSQNYCIFRDKVAEEDVPRILAWLNFQATEAGIKLMTWGPATSGLWEEVNGVRRFTNKELEDCMVYNNPNGADLKYNLASQLATGNYCLNYPPLYPGVMGGGVYSPRYVYDLSNMERSPGDADLFFNSGFFDSPVLSKSTVLKGCDVWNFWDEVPGMTEFQNVKGTGVEPLISAILATQNDAEFDAAYKKLMEFLDVNGYNRTSMDACENYLKELYPDDWETFQKGYQ